MSFLVAVDPSIRRSGVAVFSTPDELPPRLEFAATVKATKDELKLNYLERSVAMARAVWQAVPEPGRHWCTKLVVEWPQIYAREEGKSKGNPNLLTPLAGVCSALGALFSEVTVLTPVMPADWKRQMTKPVVIERVKARLSDAERHNIPPRLAHDGYEAIGIGLWALGRWERKRVFSRGGDQ